MPDADRAADDFTRKSIGKKVSREKISGKKMFHAKKINREKKMKLFRSRVRFRKTRV